LKAENSLQGTNYTLQPLLREFFLIFERNFSLGKEPLKMQKEEQKPYLHQPTNCSSLASLKKIGVNWMKPGTTDKQKNSQRDVSMSPQGMLTLAAVVHIAKALLRNEIVWRRKNKLPFFCQQLSACRNNF